MNPVKLIRKSLSFSGTFPANPYPGQTGLAPRWPLLALAPATVVNGQRWRIAEEPLEFGREYLGVAGAWVPQASKQYGVWVWVDNTWLLSDILADSYLIVNGETLSVNGEILISPKSIFEV